MSLGRDTQYDLSWEEQDKIRRRLDIKNRLKREGVVKRYSPILQMKGELLTDPAVDRYMDLRKMGRMPGAPFKAKVFFSMCAMTFLPIIVVSKIIRWERKDWIAGIECGDIGPEERTGRAIV